MLCPAQLTLDKNSASPWNQTLALHEDLLVSSCRQLSQTGRANIMAAPANIDCMSMSLKQPPILQALRCVSIQEVGMRVYHTKKNRSELPESAGMSRASFNISTSGPAEDFASFFAFARSMATRRWMAAGPRIRQPLKGELYGMYVGGHSLITWNTSSGRAR